LRRDRLAALSALIAGAALVQGCIALAGLGGAAAYSSLEDRRTTAVQIEDEGIEVRASNRLESLRDRSHVSVTSFNGAVLLTGEAWDEATRDEIGKIVAGVPNVKSVTNEIQIGALSSLGARASDTSLTAAVRGRFVNVKGFNPMHVKVVTEASVVYLLGIVTEREADAVTDVVRNTGGVRKVVRVFEYCTPNTGPCRTSAPASPPKSMR
jgi:osmotically-inducible protein OsmY